MIAIRSWVACLIILAGAVVLLPSKTQAQCPPSPYYEPAPAYYAPQSYYPAPAYFAQQPYYAPPAQPLYYGNVPTYNSYSVGVSYGHGGYHGQRHHRNHHGRNLGSYGHRGDHRGHSRHH